MRNLVLVLLAFLAVFTYIRAYEKAGSSFPEREASVAIEKTVEIDR